MDAIRIYNYLALSRGRVFGWVRPLLDEQYRTEHPIGLGSLARTLHHARAAEAMYMVRVMGDTGVPRALSPEDNPEVTTADALSFAEVESLWNETAGQTRAGLERAVAGGWLEPMRITTRWDGREYAYEASPADFFTQLVIHEVHHRTQTLHMLRRLGVETGEIDYSTMMFLPEFPEG